MIHRLHGVAEQFVRVGPPGEAAKDRVRARHHQRGARALVGDVAEQHHELVADLEVVDQVAAHFLGGLQHDVDRERLAAERAGERRRRERKLERACLVQLVLLAAQFLARLIAQRLLLQRGDDARAAASD